MMQLPAQCTLKTMVRVQKDQKPLRREWRPEATPKRPDAVVMVAAAQSHQAEDSANPRTQASPSMVQKLKSD
jgi:hypothetical protein